MVTAVGCYMKRGQVVQGDVIDLSIVLQQLPDTVHVVSLGRHVDGGQAVLWGRGHRKLVRANGADSMSGEMLDLGLGLDGSSVFQQDLDDPDVSVSGGAVERRQLVLQRHKMASGAQKPGRSRADATLVVASI